MNKRLLLFIPLLSLLLACNSKLRNFTDPKATVNFTILQFNDFYEIAPLDKGNIGGAARMATLHKKLLSENSNLLTVLAGDFISPSLIGTLKIDGEGVKGKQIIEVLNAVGIDLVTFGNHEFDYDAKTLQKRINESKFDWVSSNVLEIKDGNKDVFYKEISGKKTAIPKYKVIEFKNTNGAIVRLGIVAPCIDANKVKYVEYQDINLSLQSALNDLNNKSDFIISLSHLNRLQDKKTAEDFHQLRMVLGGHEHDNMKFTSGNAQITKADANAKSAYVHRIRYNTLTKKYKIQSELVKLDQSIPLDAEVNKLVSRWKELEWRTVREMGFDPDQEIIGSSVQYDARETTIRNQPAIFTQMICRSMLKTCPDCDAAIMNSGSVRLDDKIEGKISQYDILRALPYAGSLIELNMSGNLLQKVLDAGWSNKGRGGFLQWENITRQNNGQWLIQSKPLDTNKSYHIILNEFLLTGLEKGIEFLIKDNPEISNIISVNPNDKNNIRRDIRLAIIDYLQKGGR